MNQRTNQYSLQKEAPKRSYYDKNRAHVISSHAYEIYVIFVCFHTTTKKTTNLLKQTYSAPTEKRGVLFLSHYFYIFIFLLSHRQKHNTVMKILSYLKKHLIKITANPRYLSNNIAKDDFHNLLITIK